MCMNMSLVDKDEVPDSRGCGENVGPEGRESRLPRGGCQTWTAKMPLLGVTGHAGDGGEASASAPAAGEKVLRMTSR